MSVFGAMLAWLAGRTPAATEISAAAMERQEEWQQALAKNRLPSFVKARLAAAAAGKAPWVSTMSPAELGLARSKGIRPLGMVSGTCWYHYGNSWMSGHAAGWTQAMRRLRLEAVALGANAVVDVEMRKIRLELDDSMDFTVIGTAVRVDGLPAGKDPIIATVPALEFVRLLEAGIVPVGIAIGAQYRFHTLTAGMLASGRLFTNKALPEVGQFWESIRRQALRELRRDAQRLGNGVLAHTHFGEIVKVEGENDRPTRLLGRHIVIGTVIDTPGKIGIPHQIRTVVDMRDDQSPLTGTAPSSHNANPVWEEEGAI